MAAVIAVAAIQAKADYPWAMPSGFSTTANPNGPWSWGQSDAAGDLGSFELFTNRTMLLEAPLPLWTMPGDNNQNNASAFINTLTTAYRYVQPGEMDVSPGPDLHMAVVRWTSPISGPVTLVGSFGAGDHGSGIEGNVDVHVITTNGAGTVTGDLFDVLNTPSTQPFNLTTTVAAGNTVDFVVGNAGNWYYDSTPITVTITPEPATLSLLALGGLALLRRRAAKR
jgi:PEP-CTERM motif